MINRAPAASASTSTNSNSNEQRSWWESADGSHVQGGSLRTTPAAPGYNYQDVHLRTQGRPLEASLQVWQGPNNTPQHVQTYSQDGHARPFSARLLGGNNPSQHQQQHHHYSTATLSTYNTAPVEFPMHAAIGHNTRYENNNNNVGHSSGAAAAAGQTVQGGASRTWALDASTNAVQVVLESDGNPIEAEIEVLQGPNCVMQYVQVYNDGLFGSSNTQQQPFVTDLQLPGYGSVVRIVNKSPMTFPLRARVEPVVHW